MISGLRTVVMHCPFPIGDFQPTTKHHWRITCQRTQIPYPEMIGFPSMLVLLLKPYTCLREHFLSLNLHGETLFHKIPEHVQASVYRPFMKLWSRLISHIYVTPCPSTVNMAILSRTRRDGVAAWSTFSGFVGFSLAYSIFLATPLITVPHSPIRTPPERMPDTQSLDCPSGPHPRCPECITCRECPDPSPVTNDLAQEESSFKDPGMNG